MSTEQESKQVTVQPTYDADDWYQMGIHAFNGGQPLDLCPDYDADPDAALNWSRGWYEARDEKRIEQGEVDEFQ